MIKGHFVATRSGALFVVQFGQANPDKSILLLPSIFEEMNLSRAVLAKQAQYLADSGYCVYCLDYFGSGDSEGEIEQAEVNIWLQNITDAAAWLNSAGVNSLRLWGMRFGGLLATLALQDVTKILSVSQMILWKPVNKGKQFMTQFLRLKQANSMMQGSEKVNWRETILSGNNTDVAGYEISAQLLASIDSLEMPLSFSAPVAEHLSISWFELAAKSITPVVSKQTESWSQDKLTVSCFEGSAFWQIPEIFEQSFLHQPMLSALIGQEQKQ